MYSTIKAPTGAKYIKEIQEFSKDLPDNCYLDKTITGSGGTTHALTNEVPYVVAVPFVSLAVNKQLQHKGVLAVYSSVTDAVIKRFIAKGGKKFIVTYDSLFRLERFIELKDYKLLVDEAHKLVEYAADFKPKVINHILTRFTEFKSYVFMTATPTREEYLPDEFKDLKKIKIEWEDVEPVSIRHQRCNLQFNNIVSNLCLQHLRGERDGNAFLFYNSVQAIIKTIKTLKKLHPTLKADDVRIICADTEKNQNSISTYLGVQWSISSAVTKDEDGELIIETAPITFVTSTAFEGVDLYDPDGVTYIISDGRKVHTKLDITTQVSQIIGRIRDSKYNNTVYMLWTHSPIGNCITEEEYMNYILEEEKEAHIMIDDFNKVNSTSAKHALINYTVTNPFYIDDSEGDKLSLIYNTVAKKALMNTFIGMELTYNVINNSTNTDKDRVIVSLKDVFTALESEPFLEPLSGADKVKLGKTANFRKVAKDYEQSILKGDEEARVIIETDIDYQELVEFVEIFGVQKLTTVSYQKSYILKELEKHRLYNESPDTLRKYLRLMNNKFYSSADIKERLTNAYLDMGISKKAKATDIALLYKCNPTTRKASKGYIIVKPL